MANFVDYYDVTKPGSFSGAHSFDRNAKPWLKTQDTYTLHTPVRKKFPRRKTIVPGEKFQFQADLIDFSILKKYNDNYKFILVLIDVFSKVAYAISLKNKSSKFIIDAFRVLLTKTGHFQKLQTDRGKEFVNQEFRVWLKKQKIELFHTHNFDTKATIAERFIRTLKEKLWRYFTYKNTRRYIDVLNDIVFAYNHTFHRSIGQTPASVNKTNQEQVWQSLYGDLREKKTKLKIGDTVRLSVNRTRFRKGYLPGWTEEVFVVAEAIADDPPYYKIKDFNDEVLEGTFYDSELQKIDKNDGVYKIESILKKRKRGTHYYYLVKWLGYPESFNSWIHERDLKYA